MSFLRKRFSNTVPKSRTAALAAVVAIGLLPSRAGDLGRLVVVGDSLSAGFQNGLLLGCQQQAGYANLIAIQAESPLILPLLSKPGFGPALPAGTPPGFRIDPTVQATDLAVPGQNVAQALTMTPFFTNLLGFPYYPPSVPSDGPQMMTNVVLGFPGVFYQPPAAMSQVQWANVLSPDTVIVWIGNNDVLGVFEGVQTGITPPLTFAQNLNELLSSLVAKRRRIVIADIPDVTLLPFMAPILQADPSLTPLLKSTVLAYNTAIVGLAIRYGASIVDIYTVVNGLAKNGIVVGGQRLTTQPGGGLFSLDNIHPTNTGYAIIANAFIDAMNATLGTDIDKVNLAQVAASDPLVPGHSGIPCGMTP